MRGGDEGDDIDVREQIDTNVGEKAGFKIFLDFIFPLRREERRAFLKKNIKRHSQSAHIFYKVPSVFLIFLHETLI